MLDGGRGKREGGETREKEGQRGEITSQPQYRLRQRWSWVDKQNRGAHTHSILLILLPPTSTHYENTLQGEKLLS